MKAIRCWLFVSVLLMPLAAAIAAPMGYSLQVDGLACPFCAYGIEKKLSSIEGVAKIDVDIKTGQVIVTMSEGESLAEQVAREKVREAEFTLRTFSQVRGVE